MGDARGVLQVEEEPSKSLLVRAILRDLINSKSLKPGRPPKIEKSDQGISERPTGSVLDYSGEHARLLAAINNLETKASEIVVIIENLKNSKITQDKKPSIEILIKALKGVDNLESIDLSSLINLGPEKNGRVVRLLSKNQFDGWSAYLAESSAITLEKFKQHKLCSIGFELIRNNISGFHKEVGTGSIIIDGNRTQVPKIMEDIYSALTSKNYDRLVKIVNSPDFKNPFLEGSDKKKFDTFKNFKEFLDACIKDGADLDTVDAKINRNGVDLAKIDVDDFLNIQSVGVQSTDVSHHEIFELVPEENGDPENDITIIDGTLFNAEKKVVDDNKVPVVDPIKKNKKSPDELAKELYGLGDKDLMDRFVKLNDEDKKSLNIPEDKTKDPKSLRQELAKNISTKEHYLEYDSPPASARAVFSQLSREFEGKSNTLKNMLATYRENFYLSYEDPMGGVAAYEQRDKRLAGLAVKMDKLLEEANANEADRAEILALYLRFETLQNKSKAITQHCVDRQKWYIGSSPPENITDEARHMAWMKAIESGKHDGLTPQSKSPEAMIGMASPDGRDFSRIIMAKSGYIKSPSSDTLLGLDEAGIKELKSKQMFVSERLSQKDYLLQLHSLPNTDQEYGKDVLKDFKENGKATDEQIKNMTAMMTRMGDANKFLSTFLERKVDCQPLTVAEDPAFAMAMIVLIKAHELDNKDKPRITIHENVLKKHPGILENCQAFVDWQKTKGLEDVNKVLLLPQAETRYLNKLNRDPNGPEDKHEDVAEVRRRFSSP